MIKKLTNVQERILEYAQESIARYGYPPSFREIARHCRISSIGSVHYHVEMLKASGFLSKESGLSRGMKLTQKSSGIPILGRVTAGIPVAVQQHVEGYVEPASLMIGKKGMFALRIRGDSMSGAGILEGDIAIVNEQSYAFDKDIVVAMVDDEATIKYFYKDKDAVRLQPANPAYRPISRKDIKIIGKVIKIIRNY